MQTVLSVVSARPNFVKLAAVHHALEESCHGPVRHVIVHTGQHYDPLFSDVFFSELQLPDPAKNLGVAGKDREEVIARTQEACEMAFLDLQPDVVLVYGDVNGAVGAAQAAKVLSLRLAHVEAGLRSFDDSMPEEHNRIAIDRLADVLFCTEQSAMKNLEQEGVRGERYLTGNVMIDTLVRMQSGIACAVPPVTLPPRYAVATIHRPGNVDTPDALKRTVDFLCDIGQHIPLILPMHHRFRHAIDAAGMHQRLAEHVLLCPPMGYLPFLHTLSHAQFVLTDSGGIQEEAVYLQKRCFTARPNTERPATIHSGSNRLIDLSSPADRAAVIEAAENATQVDIRLPPLWDGKAGERIVQYLSRI